MIVYSAINEEVFHNVPVSAATLLDVGCGNGSFGEALKARQSVYIEGITYSEFEAKNARKHLDKVYTGDLNRFEFASIQGAFDCIVCSHVLEHLHEPWNVVSSLEKLLAPDGIMIIAVPNLLFFKQRWQLIKGHFAYSLNGGLMDITHLRFFDWHSVKILYENAGLQVMDKRAFGMFPQPVLRSLTPRMSKKLDRWFVNCFPGLFGLQFVIRLKRNLP